MPVELFSMYQKLVIENDGIAPTNNKETYELFMNFTDNWKSGKNTPDWSKPRRNIHQLYHLFEMILNHLLTEEIYSQSTVKEQMNLQAKYRVPCDESQQHMIDLFLKVVKES